MTKSSEQSPKEAVENVLGGLLEIQYQEALSKGTKESVHEFLATATTHARAIAYKYWTVAVKHEEVAREYIETEDKIPAVFHFDKASNKRIEQLAKKFNLGVKLPFDPERSRSNSSEAHIVVLRLYEMLNDIRHSRSKFNIKDGIEDLPLMNKIKGLPDLRKETANDWAEVILEFGRDIHQIFVEVKGADSNCLPPIYIAAIRKAEARFNSRKKRSLKAAESSISNLQKYLPENADLRARDLPFDEKMLKKLEGKDLAKLTKDQKKVREILNLERSESDWDYAAKRFIRDSLTSKLRN